MIIAAFIYKVAINSGHRKGSADFILYKVDKCMAGQRQ